MLFPSHPTSFTSRHHLLRCSRARVQGARLRWLGGAVLWLALTTGSALAQPMTVSGFSPTSGAEDTLVDVTGSAFAPDPTDQWAFVHNPLTGLGVVIDPLAGDETSWTGALGPAPGPFTGILTVWQGVRWQLPAVVIAGESGAYLISRADWFACHQSADGPGTFTVNQTSGGTIGSIDQGFALTVDLSSLPEPSPHRINLNVVIDGGTDTGTGGGEDLHQNLKLRSNGCAAAARGLRLAVDNVEPVAATPEAVARDVGSMLTQLYGAFGLRVTVQGAKLYIRWQGAAQIDRGFAVLHWESR